MARKSRSLLFLFLSILLAAIHGEADFAGTGVWEPIPDLNDPRLLKIANFAVTHHNVESKERLVLVKLVEGKEQIAAGMNYRLVLAAKVDGGATGPRMYQAVVYQEPWKNFMRLISFRELLKGN